MGRLRGIPLVVLALVLAGGVAAVVALAQPGPERSHRRAPASTSTSGGATPAPVPRAAAPRPPVRVHTFELRLTDPRRTMVVGGQTVPRSFETVIRYPTGLKGPFPLIVFGHGFAVSPAPYARLLAAWARAGYLVAAPVFPLENAGAPGGPNEHDLPNQPGDMSLVISSLTRPATAETRRIARIVDPRRIAVSGQSDGGDTALAAAYDPAVRDRRITAAVILSGAEDPFASAFTMPAGGPPLLAVQGTADTINPPWQTYQFFGEAARPKFLLKLLGAGHQPPYTEPGRELTEVERMTLAFLNRYLKGGGRALRRYAAAGSAGPGSVLTSAF